MTINPIRLTTFWSGIRSTPFVFILHAMFMAITYPNMHNLLYLAAYLFNSVFNTTAKISIKWLYKMLNVKSIPILGIGGRPSGATGCSTFLSCINTTSITFGMPSGHSQNAWFFSTFMLLELWRYYQLQPLDVKCDGMYLDTIITKHPALISILSTLLIIFAIIISYSRVWIEGCHTVQQVIVGAIIGVLLGIGSHRLIRHIIDSTPHNNTDN